MTVWLNAVLFFVIAASSMGHAPPGIHGGTLRVAHRAEPKTPNPSPAAGAPSKEVIRLLHFDLITLNLVRHLKELGLAASRRISNDGRAYTLHCMGGGDADPNPNPELNVYLSRESMHLWNRNQAARATAWGGGPEPAEERANVHA